MTTFQNLNKNVLYRIYLILRIFLYILLCILVSLLIFCFYEKILISNKNIMDNELRKYLLGLISGFTVSIITSLIIKLMEWQISQQKIKILEYNYFLICQRYLALNDYALLEKTFSMFSEIAFKRNIPEKKVRRNCENHWGD